MHAPHRGRASPSSPSSPARRNRPPISWPGIRATGAALQGIWTDADYNGFKVNTIYLRDHDDAWPLPLLEIGNAPYGTVLPDGRVAVSFNTKFRINIWVGDTNARSFVNRERPFGADRAVYSFIEPISADGVLVGTGPEDGSSSLIYLRRSRILR
ncbi:hypothetical protein [Gemmobacter aquatilis]|uniref:hypothetical protein n=1 Tax=Gemmobacter aquatilis TaxID=933059 RepID=UPI001586FBC7|nr:hypothetical protein [Gemmobacter aquatilis]